MTNTPHKELSNCCKAEIETIHGGEGTSYWACLSCGKPCDPTPHKEECAALLPEAGISECDCQPTNDRVSNHKKGCECPDCIPTHEEKEWDSLVVETAERIVIDYANLSGRESANRGAFREEVIKHLQGLLHSQLTQTATDIEKIIADSKATFFALPGETPEIPASEQLYELKAEISNNVAMYFYEKLK